MASLTDRIEDVGMAFIYFVILIGSVGLSFWATLNLTELTTTEQLAFGLVITFMALGVAFGFMRHMRGKGKR